MKKILILCLICFLSSCSLFRPHKLDIEQGNIISEDKVRQLHRGMTEAQVKEIMGTPLLTNIFSGNRVEYVYTMQKAYQDRTERRVICLFEYGHLRAVQTSEPL